VIELPRIGGLHHRYAWKKAALEIELTHALEILAIHSQDGCGNLC
jgi:hypothetical protein